MRATSAAHGRGGFALPLVLLLTVAVIALAGAAVTVGTTARAAGQHHARQELLARIADAGIAEARARLNATPSLYPDTGFAAIETNATIRDAEGVVIAGVTRSTWAGPLGLATGEYGVIGAVVSVARDAGGGVAIRRMNVPQESFAKFAYFTDDEPSNIAFGGGDQLFGPVHSNDDLRIYSSGATFFGPVTTVGTIDGRSYGDFRQGYTERGTMIPMPELAALVKLRDQAKPGRMDIAGAGAAPSGEATTRIEFVAVDLNGDGDRRDFNEGFVRVYQSSNSAWVVGGAPEGDLQSSWTCGHRHPGANNVWVAAAAHPATTGSDSKLVSVTDGTRSCYLGGDPRLFGVFTPTDSNGRWLKWTGAVSPLLGARPDRDYLFPITRALNPDFKGVIYVDGNVAVSGELRGRVTVAATGNIVIADDLVYSVDPGAGTCTDMLGLFAGGDVVMAYTPVNAAWQPSSSGWNPPYYTYDDSRDEFVHGFILTLNTFTVKSYDRGSSSAEACQGTAAGRGCLHLSGGIIQRTRGAVGAGAWGGGMTGYVKRYAYDACGARMPPPYFPTTGRFSRGTYYEVDPTGFSASDYFDMLTAGS